MALATSLPDEGSVPVRDNWRDVFRDLLLVLYCAAIGFVAAGVAASFYKLLTTQSPRFSLLGDSWSAALFTFLFFALTGPAIIAQSALKQRLDDRNGLGVLLVGALVVALWSVCSGIVVLQLALSLRHSFA
jgi:hypothetical protein